MGEVVMRGNNVMSGYFDDPEATATAFRGGWFHSGDLAVWHPDGNIELRDRRKDIIISGGENISTHRGRAGDRRASRRCSSARSSRCRTSTGASARRRSSRSRRRHARPPRRSSRSPASRLAHFKCPTRSSSGRCRRPRPARCRSTCCASASGPATRRGSAPQCTTLGEHVSSSRTSSRPSGARSRSTGRRGATRSRWR